MISNRHEMVGEAYFSCSPLSHTTVMYILFPGVPQSCIYCSRVYHSHVYTVPGWVSAAPLYVIFYIIHVIFYIIHVYYIILK